MAPIVAKFGTNDYEIKPLVIGKARAWRALLVDSVKEISGELSPEVTDNRAFTHGLAFTFLRFPEKLLEMVKAYAPDLPWEAIENEATEEQVSRVFGQIVKVAFPFATELRLVTQVLGKISHYPQSAKSTN